MIFLGTVMTMKSLAVSIFSLTCFILAGYMAFQQFKEYFSNQDFTTISRHKFFGEKHDWYPTISICLYGINGEVFHRQKEIRNLASPPMCKSCDNGLNRNRCISNGTWSMGSCGPEEYFRAMSGMLDNRNITNLPFEWMTYDARKFVLDHETKTKEGKRIHELGKLLINGNISGLVTNYQDPKHICVQKRRNYESSKPLRQEYWKLSLRRMLSILGEFDIRIYVHQKGQLLRNLGAPTFFLSNHFIKNEKMRFAKGFTYQVDLQLNAVDVLHKRPDSSKSCDNDTYDEDAVWISHAIEQLNCTPPFWDSTKSIFQMNGTNRSSRACNKEKLSEFYSKYEPEFHFEQIARYYKQPCFEIYVRR